MSRVVHVASEVGRLPIARARVAALADSVLRAEGVRDALLSITFLPPSAIARLNRRHLGHAGPTDVIAFHFAPAGADTPVIGDIYIATEVARANARAHGVGLREELARLVVHGTLHVLGYDHPDGAKRVRSAMWRRQERLLRRALGARA